MSYPNTFFAFRVWLIAYVVIAILIALFIGALSIPYKVSIEGLVRGLIDGILPVCGGLLVWGVVSSIVFLWAYLAKRFSQNHPFSIFIFLPLPLSIFSIIIYYYLYHWPTTSSTEYMMAVFASAILIFMASIFLIPLNFIFWVYSILDYKSAIDKSSFRDPTGPRSFSGAGQVPRGIVMEDSPVLPEFI